MTNEFKLNDEVFLNTNHELEVTGMSDGGNFEISTKDGKKSCVVNINEIQGLIQKMIFQYMDEDAKEFVNSLGK